MSGTATANVMQALACWNLSKIYFYSENSKPRCGGLADCVACAAIDQNGVSDNERSEAAATAFISGLEDEPPRGGRISGHCLVIADAISGSGLY